MSQLRTKYNGLKNEFRTKQQTAQTRLQAQQRINDSHFHKSLSQLNQQFKETERQKKLQQMMLAKHYKHQKEIMKQRHDELLRLKQQLQNIQSHENQQIEKEEKLHKRHERLMEIQNDFSMRSAKVESDRKLLENRKNAILNEMQKFDDLTQSMSKLNLNGDNITPQEQKELEEFISKNPAATVDDYSYNNYQEFRNSLQMQSNGDSDDDYIPRQSRKRIERKEREIKNESREIRRYSRKREKTNSDHKSSKKRSRSRKKKKGSRRRSRSMDKIRKMFRRKSRKRENSNDSSNYGATPNYQQSSSSKKRRKSRRRSASNEYTTDKRRKSKHSSSKRSGNLYVRLVNARGIFGPKGSTMNTYVELTCNNQIFESSISRKQTNPEWNEIFEFYVHDYRKDKLSVKLINVKTGKIMAKMTIPVEEFINNQAIRKSNEYQMADQISMNLDIDYEKSILQLKNDSNF